MFVFANLVYAVAAVVNMVLSLYMWIVIIAALLSWVNPDPFNPIVRFLRSLTEPVFYWLRRRIPLIFGGIDLSPLVVIGAIIFLKYFLVSSLYQAAQLLK